MKQPRTTTELQAARAEIARLRWMIEYAREAPNLEACKSVLRDALDGCTGADNVEEIRRKRKEASNDAKTSRP